MGKNDSAISYLELIKRTGRENNIPIQESIIFLNLGLLYQERKMHTKAIENAELAIQMARESGEQYDIANSLLFAATLYLNPSTKKKAEMYFNEAEEIATRLNSKQFWSQFYLQYSKALEDFGDYKGALMKYQRYIQLADSLTETETAKHVSELDHQYQAKERQKTIELLNKEKQLASLEAEEHRLLNYFLWAGIGASVFIGALLYNRYRLKNKANKTLNHQKLEIEKQHHLLERKNNLIGESIDYAKKIQDSFLCDLTEFRKVHKDSFVFWQPKDVVSGDFLWFFESDKYKFIALADCTGHGVPGAFMSIVCNNLLTQSVQFMNLECPGKILDHINKEIINHFNSITENGLARDGMDIVLLRYGKSDGKIVFSSAHNSLFRWNGYEMEELKTGMTSIGIPKATPFETIEFNWTEGSYLFMSSDGYYDQRSKKMARKLMKPDFKHILAQTIPFGSSSQKEDFLLNEFINWKDGGEQTDDILVTGFRF
jgi:tetratricopeptide (TPR) repeat protein